MNIALRFNNIFISLWLFLCCGMNVTIINACRVGAECLIICSGKYDTNWGKEIMEIMANELNCGNVILRIENGQFPDQVLHDNWLNLTPGTSISELYFNKADFTTIQPKALDISNLKQLTFEMCKITYLTKESFAVLKDLNTFYYTGSDLKVEAKLFENLLNLQTLQIANGLTDPQVVDNITGIAGSKTSLESVHLENNILNEIPDNLFSNAPALRGIRLTNSRVKHISKKAFWGPSIQQLYLDDNELTTLENGTFSDVSNAINSDYSYIFLKGNRWKCDCDLKWLKDIYMSEKSKINHTETPYCDNDKDKPFETEKFECDDNGNDDDDDDEEEGSGNNGNETAENVRTLKCDDASKFEYYETSGNANREYFMTMEINITKSEQELIRMDMYNLDYNPEIEIDFDGDLENVYLIYFEIFNSRDAVCLTNMKQQLTLSNLKRNHTYTFCLISSPATQGKSCLTAVNASPTSCFGVKIPPDWSKRAWIRNESQTFTISIVAGSLLLCSLISSLVMYFVIRHYPKLIKGNKDVIIVKRAAACPKTTPELDNFDRPEYTEPSGYAQPSGYLTPAYPQYEKINYYTRRLNSIYGGSNSNSYIRPGFSGGGDINPLRRINETEKIETYIATGPRSGSRPTLPRVDKLYY